MELSYAPKHVLIAEQIRNAIKSGSIQIGEKLRADTRLAAEYGVNKRTVANGLSILVAEGILSRTPGRGTVVLRKNPEPAKKYAVGVVAINSGDGFSDMGKAITEGLIRHGCYPVWAVPELFMKATSTPEYTPFTAMLEHMIRDCSRGMIIWGERFFPISLLKRNMSRLDKLVFFGDYLFEEKIEGAKYLLFDRAEAGRIAVKHLAANGHKRITFLGLHHPIPSKRGIYPQMLFIRAMAAECEKLGLDFDMETAMRLDRGDSIEDVLKSAFAHGLTGAMLFYDSCYNEYFKPVLDRLGIRVPRDLSLIGCYNTPWADKSEPPLTSIDLRFSDLGRFTVSMFFGETRDCEVFLKPKLVERSSIRKL